MIGKRVEKVNVSDFEVQVEESLITTAKSIGKNLKAS
jgi:hypothetical protein